MVVEEHGADTWQPDCTPTPGSSNLHRCIKDGWGRCLQQNQDKRQMVRRRELATYKHDGIKSGFLSDSIIAKGSTSRDGQPEHGQLNSSVIRQPRRGDSVPGTQMTL